MDHPDAKRVKSMTAASRRKSLETGFVVYVRLAVGLGLVVGVSLAGAAGKFSGAAGIVIK